MASSRDLEKSRASRDTDDTNNTNAESSSFLYNPEAAEARGQTPRWRRYSHYASYGLNIVLASVLLATIFSSKECSDPSIEYSPASAAVSYKQVRFTNAFGNDTTKYQGWPNDEIDELWSGLYHNGLGIAISKDEVDQSRVEEAKAEHLPVEGREEDYYASLDVFHQLHCLDMVRKGFYPDRYNMSFYDEDGSFNRLKWLHVDHCIETIRQRLVCTGDVTVPWYRWAEEKEYPRLITNVGVPHTCRDFEALQEWAFSRKVPFVGFRNRVVEGEIVDYDDGLPEEETFMYKFYHGLLEPDGI